jgi:small neutral amino acid transporter SnatA (MarC family)
MNDKRSDRIDQSQSQSQATGAVPNALHSASGGVITAIDATAHVAEEVLHAAGRVGTTALDEIFGLLTAAMGGIGETASAIFQGRRVPRRPDSTDTEVTRRAS